MKVIFDDEEQKRGFIKSTCLRWFGFDNKECVGLSQNHCNCEECMNARIEMEVERKMKISKTVEITFNEKELKSLIAEKLRSEGYNASENDVNFHVGMRCEGYGPGEHNTPYFRDCTVSYKE